MLLKPIPDYGDLMTLAEFKENCLNKYITDQDGSADWATATEISDIPAYCSDAWRMFKHTGEFTHVVWFNK